jgi:hypothetical protein
MLQPHTPGQPFDVAIHGAVIRPSGHWESLYQFHDGWKFSRFWERAGLPTDEPVPQLAVRVMQEAFGLTGAARAAKIDCALALIANEAIERECAAFYGPAAVNRALVMMPTGFDTMQRRAWLFRFCQEAAFVDAAAGRVARAFSEECAA